MLNAKYEVLLDSTKDVKDDAVIVAGRPVTLNADGLIIAADDTTSVYGLSKADKNQYRDDTYGEFGAYGSRKLSVLVKGLAEVAPSEYDDVDLEISVTLHVYDETVVDYAIDDPIYVNSDGKLSNVVAGSSVIVGKLVKVPTGTDPVMEVLLS